MYFAGLNDRITKSIEILEGLDAGEIDGTEEKDVEYVVSGVPRPYKGQQLI